MGAEKVIFSFFTLCQGQRKCTFPKLDFQSSLLRQTSFTNILKKGSSSVPLSVPAPISIPHICASRCTTYDYMKISWLRRNKEAHVLESWRVYSFDNSTNSAYCTWCFFYITKHQSTCEHRWWAGIRVTGRGGDGVQNLKVNFSGRCWRGLHTLKLKNFPARHGKKYWCWRIDFLLLIVSEIASDLIGLKNHCLIVQN